MQAVVGLLDTDVMPICIIIALGIIITLHFSINCSTAICSPTILFAFKREASSENYGPRVCFPSYIFRSINQKNQKYLAAIYLRLFCFMFYSLRSQIFVFLDISNWLQHTDACRHILEIHSLCFVCSHLLKSLERQIFRNGGSSNLLYLSLSDLTFASDREGIDDPFIAFGASVWLFV